jgi:DNA-3-methyladenine glycosylase II
MTVHLNAQTDLDDAVHELVRLDPRLGPVLETAGMPSLRRREPGFAGLAAIVCGQQLSTKAAAAIWSRVSTTFDPFHHEAVKKARADRLGRLGLSAAKIKSLKFIARELSEERLNLDVLAEEDADAAHATLTRLHGIGPWTADIYLLFCLGHGDAWPAGDLAIQEAMRIGLGLKSRPTVKEMQPLAEPWRPLRGAAASVVVVLSRYQEARRCHRRNRDNQGAIEEERREGKTRFKHQRRFKQIPRRKIVSKDGEDCATQDSGKESGSTDMTSSTQFVVGRNDLAACRVIETPLPGVTQLPEDGLLVQVDRFAFTANNITYAMLGDQLKYWDLFPAPKASATFPSGVLGG